MVAVVVGVGVVAAVEALVSVPKDALKDYERALSRSLLLWQNIFQETSDLVDGPDKVHARAVAAECSKLRQSLEKQDSPVLETREIWACLDKELDELHKKGIHTMPNRELGHRKIRIIEDLIMHLKQKQRE